MRKKKQSTASNEPGLAGSELKLILETDAIVTPLTGIGRYTLELLKGFQRTKDIRDLKCISRGQWHSPENIIHEQLECDNKKNGGSTPTARHRWRRNPIKMLASRLLPLVQQQALKRFSDSHIYHAPNYRLTPYEGKKIVTFHDLSLQKFPEFHPQDRLKILGPAIEKAAQQADHLITDTEQVRAEVISYFGLPASRVTAIHLASSLDPGAVDPALKDDFLRSLDLKPAGYFLFVSTLEPRKNIAGLLAAFEMLPAGIRQRYPLVLAGQLGWNSQDIVEPLQRARNSGQVLQPGFMSNQQLCYLYAGAKAFVYPSLYEGFGLPIIEAQGFGVPVITSNRSCLPEIVGESGILIDPQDHAALAAAMQLIIEDDPLHARLARDGLQNWQRFSWSKTAAETVQVYRSVLRA